MVTVPALPVSKVAVSVLNEAAGVVVVPGAEAGLQFVSVSKTPLPPVPVGPT